MKLRLQCKLFSNAGAAHHQPHQHGRLKLLCSQQLVNKPTTAVFHQQSARGASRFAAHANAPKQQSDLIQAQSDAAGSARVGNPAPHDSASDGEDVQDAAVQLALPESLRTGGSVGRVDGQQVPDTKRQAASLLDDAVSDSDGDPTVDVPGSKARLRRGGAGTLGAVDGTPADGTVQDDDAKAD